MGYLWLILASVAFGTVPPVSALLQASGMNDVSILAFGNALGCVALLVIARVKGASLKVTRKQGISLATLGFVAYGATQLLLTASYRYLMAGICTVIHFVYPVIVTLIMRVMFRERLELRKLVSIACALVGIALFADLEGGVESADVVCGVVLALLSGVAYAVYTVSSEKSGFAELDAVVVTLYIHLLSAGGFFGYGVATNSVTMPSTTDEILLLLAFSACGVAGLLLFTKGVRMVGASRGAVINMLEPAVSVVLSIILIGGTLSVKSIAGCGLILGSSLLAAVRRNKKALGAPVTGDGGASKQE